MAFQATFAAITCCLIVGAFAERMYGVIGRLAMLAASYELEATDPEPETES